MSMPSSMEWFKLIKHKEVNTEWIGTQTLQEESYYKVDFLQSILLESFALSLFFFHLSIIYISSYL
jgi:hypothetical protein